MSQSNPSTSDAGQERDALSGLVDTLDTLERRIFGGESHSGRLISAESLDRILRRAGVCALASVERSESPDAPRLDLSADVKRVIDTKSEMKQSGHLLSLRHAALLQIVESLFRYLEYTADLEPDAYARIQYLQTGLARILVADPNVLSRPDHPARQLLEALVNTGKTYDPHSGPSAENLMGQIGGIVKAAVEAPRPTENAYSSGLREYFALIEAHSQDALEDAKKLVVKEKGEFQSNDAKLAVKQGLQKAVEGKKLPLVMLEFLQQIWSKYLYVTYLRHGMDSREWHNSMQDIHILIRSVGVRDRDQLFRLHSTQLNRILARVRLGADSIHGDWALTRDFFLAMDTLYEARLAGLDPVMDEAVVGASSDEAAEGSEDEVDQLDDLRLIDSLKVGDWYKLPEKGLELRCKLIEKNLQHGYCLFANLSGRKVAAARFSRIAGFLQAGLLKRIDTSPVFDNALAFACRQIAEQIPKLEAKAEQTERERAAILEQKRQEESAERLRRLEEERLRQETQLLEEKRRRERELARQKSEARLQAERSAREDALRQVLTDIERMQPDGRAEFVGEDGQTMTCKLALKLRSSGKLIFVNQLGRRVQELLPEEFAELILDGGATILSYGVAYDYGLQSLILTRDKKLDGEH